MRLPQLQLLHPPVVHQRDGQTDRRTAVNAGRVLRSRVSASPACRYRRSVESVRRCCTVGHTHAQAASLADTVSLLLN